MSLAKRAIPELPSGPSTPNDYSPRSDLEEHVDPDAYEIEQESAKLQAEVHKLSKELEDLMSSRRLSEMALKRDSAGDEDREPLGEVDNYEEREAEWGLQETQLSSGDREIQRPRTEPKERTPKRQSASPSFPPMAQRSYDAPASMKSDSFGLMAPRPPPPTEKKRPPSESRSSQNSWRRVNELLQQQGFRSIPLRNDSEALDIDLVCQTLKEVLTDFTRCVESLDSEEKRIKSLQAEMEPLQNEIGRLKVKLDEERAQHQEDRFEADRQAREAERQISNLKGKLETAQMQCKQRDQLIEQLKERPPIDDLNLSGEAMGSDRDKAIFKRYFGRDARRGMDEQVLNLISAYEERRKKHTPEPKPADLSRSSALQDTVKDLRAQVDLQSRENESLEKQRSALAEENMRLKAQLSKVAESDKPATSEVIAKALETLQLKSEKQLPMALKKMQQVIRALPGLEHFIRSISAEVLSESSESSSVENVLPTIRTWKQKAVMWETANSARTQLCHLLRLDSAADFAEIVRLRQMQAVRGTGREGKGSAELAHFKTLFEVGADEDVQQTMNQVFLFVHEMKAAKYWVRTVL